MSVKSIDLVWIVVNDLKKAVQFYTETLGLELMDLHESHGWAELQAKTGIRLGLAQHQGGMPIAPGQNAVTTLTVANLEESKEAMTKKGIVCIGEMQEVPGHVRLQLVRDLDGNHLQLAQVLVS